MLLHEERDRRCGDIVHDLVTVTGDDDDGRRGQGSDDAAVTVDERPVEDHGGQDGEPEACRTAAPVTFTNVVRNNSAVDTVSPDAHRLDRRQRELQGEVHLEDGIAAGRPAQSDRRCIVDAELHGHGLETTHDIVTATGVDNDDNRSPTTTTRR